MPYVFSGYSAAVGDLGDVPGPCPPEGCPPGTTAKKCTPGCRTRASDPGTAPVCAAGCYPNRSSSCCKGTPTGATAGTTTGSATGAQQSGPESSNLPSSGQVGYETGTRTPLPQDTSEPWYAKYRWYLIGGSSALLLVVVAAMLMRRRTAEYRPTLPAPAPVIAPAPTVAGW